MRYLKKFESFPGENYTLTVKNSGDKAVYTSNGSKVKEKELIYNSYWESNLPENITIIYHDKNYTFKKGNVMLLGDLVEITYENIEENSFGQPETLEFDLYFTKDVETNKMKILVDITYGDLMACEFSVESPNTVDVIQHTTYHSKFDPSNTVFALEEESLVQFIKFLNKFPGVKLNRYDLRFLDKYDNWTD